MVRNSLQDAPRHVPARRAYLEVAGRLCALLAQKGYRKGDRIPSESELLTALDVGRPLLREATVALQAGGQIAAKPGTGLFLLDDPNPEWRPVEPSMDLGPSIVEQIETRMLVECELAEQAATFIAPADLARLEALVTQMQSNDTLDDPRLGIEFQITLARGSGRKLLPAIVETIYDMRQGPMWTALRQQTLKPEHYRRTVADRAAIVAALKAGNGPAARRATKTMLEVIHFRFFEDQPEDDADTQPATDPSSAEA